MFAPARYVPEAVKEVIPGAEPFRTVTVIAEEVATLASVSVVDAVTVCEPLDDDAVFHTVW